MPDLIIKPKNQSGNKLILQDQTGGAVLTTADSGATIANATLNSPTLVTPALGTVASGNLSNSAIVYPSEHVVQVVKRVSDTQYNFGAGATTWYELHDYYISITPIKATSRIYLSFNWANMFANQHSEEHFQIKREVASVSTVDLLSRTGMGYNDSSVWHSYRHNYQWVDTPGAGQDVEVKYQPWQMVSADVTTSSNARTAYQGHAVMIATEVLI